MFVRILHDFISDWEVDWIQELFSDFQCSFNWMTKEDFEKPEKFINTGPLIVTISTNNTIRFETFKQFCEKSKPYGLVILSDEWGNREYYHNLAPLFKFVLRQYEYTTYRKYDNVLTIPLGYNRFMFPSFSTDLKVAPMKNRNKTWTFVGQIKSDRAEMISTFSKWKSGIVLNRISCIEMSKLYQDSIFVPNGRGNYNLNCFRVYEASICGAIPVVVGSKEEIYHTYGNPPWIFGETWNEALIKCQALYENLEALQIQQDLILKWWSDNVHRVKKFINEKLVKND